MGNDGGVIAVKRKFMRHGNTKARGEKADAEALRAQKTQMCALSDEPLRAPVVACALGNLFNKQALLEQLLAKSLPARFRHVASLRDVVECRFTERGGRRCCPVSLVEFNGAQPFVVLPACGCVVAERSLREVRASECLACGAPLAEDAAAPIALAPALDDTEYERRQRELLERKEAEKQQRRKEKQQRKKTAAADSESGGAADVAKEKAEAKKKRKAESQPATAAPPPPSKIAKDAASAIAREKQKSAVFASLFSDKKAKSDKKSANELLMTVGGLRYTLS